MGYVFSNARSMCSFGSCFEIKLTMIAKTNDIGIARNSGSKYGVRPLNLTPEIEGAVL